MTVEQETQAGDETVRAAEAEVKDQPAGQEEPAAEKPKKTFTQEELDHKMARERRSWERKKDRELAELKGRLEELSKKPAAAAKDNSGETTLVAPKRDDYATYEEYLEARADYRTDLRNQERDEKLRKQQEQERTERQTVDRQKELTKLANDRISEGRKEFADFDQVIADAFEEGILEQDTELYLGILESSIGHRLAHFLANNPDEAERIGKLPPRSLHRELGKLEDKLSKTPEKKKTEAMETLGGSGRVIKANDPMREDMSMDEYVRLRNEQEDRKRKGR